MERKPTERRRAPSRLALQLADAFAPCAQWSEVRVTRGAGGQRSRVIVGANGAPPAASATTPFDWSTGAL